MKKFRSDFDMLSLLLYLALLCLGWVAIYAASNQYDLVDVDFFDKLYGKQLLFMMISLSLGVAIYWIPFYYRRLVWLAYFMGLLLLAGLFVFGKRINGAISWYQFGGITLQPSEFAKITTLLLLAKLFERRQQLFDFVNIYVAGILVVFCPVLLVLLQPDPGSMLIYLSLLFIFMREGIAMGYLSMSILLFSLFLLYLWFGFYITLILFSVFYFLSYYLNNRYHIFYSDVRKIFIYSFFIVMVAVLKLVDYTYHYVFEERHRNRINLTLGLYEDTQGIGYNRNQSILSIRLGNLYGKGFLKGERTLGNFVPEQTTDYIFSTVAEQFGFIGALLVLILFTGFILRIFYLAEQQKNTFHRVFGYGFALIFLGHFFINIGMAIGVLPTVGIPLPLFSYGGSSLMSFTILFFLFLKFNKENKGVFL